MTELVRDPTALLALAVLDDALRTDDTDHRDLFGRGWLLRGDEVVRGWCALAGVEISVVQREARRRQARVKEAA